MQPNNKSGYLSKFAISAVLILLKTMDHYSLANVHTVCRSFKKAHCHAMMYTAVCEQESQKHTFSWVLFGFLDRARFALVAFKTSHDRK